MIDSPPSTRVLITVDRGMQVLRAFRSCHRPLSNADLVHCTALPKATISRLTGTLLELGILWRVPGKRTFMLSAEGLGAGQAFIDGSELVARSQPLMQQLADEFQGSVALAAPDGVDMLYIVYRAGCKVRTLRLGVGSLLPMGSTAIGHAYLWSLSPGIQTAKLADIRRAAGLHAETLNTCIENSFAQLAETGTCAVLGRYRRNTYGIAMPMEVGRDRIKLALSYASVQSSCDIHKAHREIGPRLIALSNRLTAALAELEVIL